MDNENKKLSKKDKDTQKKNILEQKIREIDLLKRKQKLSVQEFNLKKLNSKYVFFKRFLNCLYILFFSHLFLCHVFFSPFSQLQTDRRTKIRFTNYDKHNRREVLKNFLDVSYFRHAVDEEEEIERLENDPLPAQFLIANNSKYGRAMDEPMKTFVTRKQELSNVDFRGAKSINRKFFQKTGTPRPCFLKITIILMKEIPGRKIY